jgi:hypothetical protein
MKCQKVGDRRLISSQAFVNDCIVECQRMQSNIAQRQQSNHEVRAIREEADKAMREARRLSKSLGTEGVATSTQIENPLTFTPGILLKNQQQCTSAFSDCLISQPSGEQRVASQNDAQNEDAPDRLNGRNGQGSEVAVNALTHDMQSVRGAVQPGGAQPTAQT